MKIFRYLFQQLFNSAFDNVCFGCYTINSEMMELLFYENETNMPLQIYSKKARLEIKDGNTESFFPFIWNHLVSNVFKLDIYIQNNTEKHYNNLFKILTTGRNKFSAAYFCCHNQKYYNLIIQVIVKVLTFWVDPVLPLQIFCGSGLIVK
ncbi:unnamed protein product [Meloidogyne enterolobii]|uniref:Uncharacterized protein n=1 Tax=Meloidogyne enterolobii TaxID=390850 RepID=A0ACB0YLZ0_MELEN